MAEEQDIKRINVLIPMDLFVKFQEYSSKEYKNTTSMIIDWMVQYVTEKDKLNNRTRSFFATSARLTKLSRKLENLGWDNLKPLLTELNTLWELSQKDPGIGDSPDFKAELISLEKAINSLTPDDGIPF